MFPLESMLKIMCPCLALWVSFELMYLYLFIFHDGLTKAVVATLKEDFTTKIIVVTKILRFENPGQMGGKPFSNGSKYLKGHSAYKGFHIFIFTKNACKL